MTSPQLSDADWLRRRYETDRAPIEAIAAEAEADLSQVHRWLRRHGIPPRYAHAIDRGDLERRLAAGQPIAAIAEAYGVDDAVVRDRMYTWGLAAVEIEGATPAQLRLWYDRYRWPVSKIAERLGASTRTARRRLLAAGVTLRPRGRPPNS